MCVCSLVRGGFNCCMINRKYLEAPLLYPGALSFWVCVKCTCLCGQCVFVCVYVYNVCGWFYKPVFCHFLMHALVCEVCVGCI